MLSYGTRVSCRVESSDAPSFICSFFLLAGVCLFFLDSHVYTPVLQSYKIQSMQNDENMCPPTQKSEKMEKQVNNMMLPELRTACRARGVKYVFLFLFSRSHTSHQHTRYFLLQKLSLTI